MSMRVSRRDRVSNRIDEDLPVVLIDERIFSRGALRVIAALCGLIAVALGAFGAHALRSTLASLATVDAWNTASLYHLVHSAVLLFIALVYPTARFGFWLFLAGIVLFSGSLYVYSVTGLKAVAMAAPVGGMCLMGGWLALAFPKRRGSENSGPE